MVTLQILVLPFLVRVRVSQQRSQVERLDFFFYLHFLIFGQRARIGGVGRSSLKFRSGIGGHGA